MSSKSRAIILTYHSISDGPPPLAISPALFAEQMEWLKANASVVPLGEIVDALQNRRTLPQRCVALTFDDGYLDFLLNAHPMLSRLQLPATVFLPTDHCGQTNVWSRQSRGLGQQPLMPWEKIRQLAGQGIEFGSHGASHVALDGIGPEELDREISGSKKEITARLDRAPDFFCYPYGIWNPAVRDVVRRHYRAACSTGAGLVEPASDPYALPRVDAHYVRDPAWFHRMFSLSFGAYVALRRLIRRLRSRPEGFLSRV